MTEAADPRDPAPASAQQEAGANPLAGVPEPLDQALRKRGFEGLTPVQRAVVDTDALGRDLRISSQTGSGKTVAIGLALAQRLAEAPAGKPGSRRGPSVLVLVPTRELALQVREELAWLFQGLREVSIQVVMGGTALGVERRMLSRRPEIVVGTPGRTLDHLRAGALVCDGIEDVVLDEADRMLDMGFREELEAILEALPEARRTHLMSATFPGAVRKLADRFQRDALHIEGTRLGAANLDIEHVAHVVEPRDCYAALVNLLLLNDDERCLVFVERRVDVASLAAKLTGDGFAVSAFSGELPQAQRTRTLDAFRSGAIKTLVSTDVAARGIDVPEIDLVVHVDLPGDADTYVHRSGRTGRAGRAGRSVMLVPSRGRGKIERQLRFARIRFDWKPVPSAAVVRKQLRKRYRKQLHDQLAIETVPTQPQIDYAKGLLDGRDPAVVVARLIELAEPSLGREPMEVGGGAGPDRSRGERPQGQRSYGERPQGQGQRAYSERPRQGSRAPSEGYVRFLLNWGENNGAAPNRVLGHVCRRGQVRSQKVGSIEIGPDESSVDIEASVADRFEALVRKRDSRDPHLRIVRAGASRGPKPRS